VIKVLVATKCDNKERKISKENGENIASQYNMKYFETLF